MFFNQMGYLRRDHFPGNMSAPSPVFRAAQLGREEQRTEAGHPIFDSVKIF